jgi:hypothetical protein
MNNILSPGICTGIICLIEESELEKDNFAGIPLKVLN